jgi:molybdenum cofactor cytidylyltransferase
VVRGVILAAGASSRMGRPKAALRLEHPGDTFLSRLLRTYIVAGIPDVVVVTGANAELVRASAGPPDARIRFAHNAAWETGQLSSLLAGLAAHLPGAGGRDDTIEAVMMTLVDVPLVLPATCVKVLSAWRATRAAIVRPARGGEHGHPVIFDRVLFDALRAADPRHGAKAVVRANADRILDVPIDDDGAFTDIDTPAEYETLLRRTKTPQSLGGSENLS